MPTDRLFKAANLLHRSILRASRGRIGWNLGGMRVLALTTFGRTTGQVRTVLLTSPLTVGNEIVLVASRGGDDRHPGWYLNIERNPNVEVKFHDGARRRCRARIASASERDALWPRVVARHAVYARYQTMTPREIPLVLLGPVPSDAPPATT